MKKLLAMILACAMLTGCAPQVEESTEVSPKVIVTEAPVLEETVPDFDNINDNELLEYMGDSIYAGLVETLDDEEFFVESINTGYISKEYLEELNYNSQENIFFGYTLAELDAAFNDTRYAFTLGEDGQTIVTSFEEYDDTYEQVLKDVAIGSGVILVSITVAIITKNPAASATAGKTVKLIFACSSRGAKAGTILALQSAGITGTIAAIIEGIRSGDPEAAAKAGLLGAGEGFKIGAIFGTAKGIADGIRVVGNSRYFPSGSEQAAKYPEGVEFTRGPNGESYPRFEPWAEATAKFDSPTLDNALNHTGLSGNYWWDSKLANMQCGVKNTPAGYVWHHVEDMKTMILVPQDLHSVAMGGMSHVGGASLIRTFLGI